MTNKHLIDINQVTTGEVDLLLDLALRIADDMSRDCKCKSVLTHHILATLFFEASTRTRMSFESAMLRLGGKVVSIDDSTFFKKDWPSLNDLAQVVSQYVDVVAVRHPQPGSVESYSLTSEIPVINAGDGPNQHPTQALLDLFTIRSQYSSFDGVHVGFVGDLKYGRTVHSLVSLLQRYNVKMTFIAHDLVQLPTGIQSELEAKGVEFVLTSDIETVLPDLDVLYVTRVQKERFDDISQYDTVKSQYQVNKQLLSIAKVSLMVLHPFPRVDEISTDIDDDPRAQYFNQAENGVYVRMAILCWVLDKLEAVNQALDS